MSKKHEKRLVGLLALVSMLVGLAGVGCGGSGAGVCESILEEACARRDECTSGMMKRADCEAEARKTINCAQPDLSCPAGKHYDVTTANQCLSTLQAAMCSDVLAGAVSPCTAVCQ